MKQKIKIIALDMDGVVNSLQLNRKWIFDRMEIQLKNPNNLTDEEARIAVRKAYIKEFVHSEELVFPELSERITRICDQTDCYILWTSTWRKLERYKDIEKAKDMFNRRGLPGDKLIAYTPQMGMSWAGHCRGSQIAQWIKYNENYEIVKCAVIDDRDDAGFNLPDNSKFFQTIEYYGITEELTQQIIDFLK